jgi:hypothetical protein
VLRRRLVPVPEPGRGLLLGGVDALRLLQVDGGGPAGAYLDASAGEGLQQQGQRRDAGGELLQVGHLRGVVGGRRGGWGGLDGGLDGDLDGGLDGFEVGAPFRQVAGLLAVVLADSGALFVQVAAPPRPGGQVRPPAPGAQAVKGGLEGADGGDVLRAQHPRAGPPEHHPLALDLDPDPCRQQPGQDRGGGHAPMTSRPSGSTL